MQKTGRLPRPAADLSSAPAQPSPRSSRAYLCGLTPAPLCSRPRSVFCLLICRSGRGGDSSPLSLRKRAASQVAFPSRVWGLVVQWWWKKPPQGVRADLAPQAGIWVMPSKQWGLGGNRVCSPPSLPGSPLLSLLNVLPSASVPPVPPTAHPIPVTCLLS